MPGLLELMTVSLNMPEKYVLGMASRATHAYKTYKIPKKTKGEREIHHPSRPLKALQRWLVENIIAQWPVHPAARAYRHRYNILRNATPHANSRFLLRLDLTDFFPSISAGDVRRYLEQDPPGTAEWSGPDRQLFVRLVCREQALTIGAPTSPGLSNAICHQLDGHLSAMASSASVEFTRYADDLFFSSKVPHVLPDIEQQVRRILGDLEMPANLQLNQEKTQHFSKRQRRQVTGLVLTPDGRVTVGRHRKRYIRRQIHRLADLTDDERQELAGHIAFLRSIEPTYVNALVLKYDHESVRAASQGRAP